MPVIGPDDIDAFQRRWSDSLNAADEYARRKEKGLPSDRWADGKSGEMLVANGIRAQQRLLEMYASFALEVMAAERARNDAAMDATPDPMRDGG